MDANAEKNARRQAEERKEPEHDGKTKTSSGTTPKKIVCSFCAPLKHQHVVLITQNVRANQHGTAIQHVKRSIGWNTKKNVNV
jgi:hypothetical protein